MTTLPRPLPLTTFPPLKTSPNLSPKFHKTLIFSAKPPSLSATALHHHRRRNHRRPLLRATENGAQTDSDTTPQQPRSEEADQLAEVGAEIRKAIKDREVSGDGGGFWGGVVEEIGMIEWPEFGKVLGTTVVVLGVIAGSSVVLLTLNAVLAELSDQVFAGKGVQDFFAG